MKKLLITSVFALFALALPGMAAPPAKKTPAKPAETAPAADAKPADAAAPAPDAAKPAEKPKAEAAKKKTGSAGIVTAVDAEKKTITIGKTKPVVYAITDTTEYVNKDTSKKDAPEAPATLADVKEGMNIGFSYTTEKDKRTIVHVNVGVKQPDAPKTKAEPAKPKAPAEKKKPA